ncbi:hypothetical protein SAMN05443549_11528 [Flavobacterium fluvii]|uniref:Uncharacterized protein n=1 Tax=Flavobacterium fluvii TaxID=468056 RepID=A0A1M5Q148_9FLAO|nr:hypothetical protein [Flavobacterium fluvii]SHH07636.1 hypothetical protein SAMN05443549_11528 [Flavobacterium fluvii]
MKKSITDSLKKVVKENKVSKEDFSAVKSYYEAIKIYDNLVSDGLAEKRGYNLKTIDSKNNLVLFNSLV